MDIKEYFLFFPFLKNLGKELMEIYNSSFEVKLKLDNSPLTKADLLSHNNIMFFLKEHFSNDGIISEECETAENVYSKKRVWVIDPLDGTKDFIQKTGEFSIMIALLEEGKPLLGMVYVPAKKEFYFAKKGLGSFFQKGDSSPIQINVSAIKSISNFTLVRSRNHFSEIDENICSSLSISNFIKMGSVGVKFGEIAKGDAELCYYSNSNMGIWDDAAAHVILTEAGGEVFDINGNNPEYDLRGRNMKFGFIGTNGFNKEKILKKIQDNLN